MMVSVAETKPNNNKCSDQIIIYYKKKEKKKQNKIKELHECDFSFRYFVSCV